MRKFIFIACAALSLHAYVSVGQTAEIRDADTLRAKLGRITRIDGKVGFAAMHLTSKETMVVNENDHFPMQSVYKFPLGMAVLREVDKGTLKLDQRIFVAKKEMLPNTHSPIARKYPKGDVWLTLEEVLTYTVSESDNNGCDILFRLLGGPAKVNDYVQGLGIKDIAIKNTEEEMPKAWDVQYANYASPAAMLNLLNIAFYSDQLSPISKDLLWKMMVKTPTGPKRLKGLLPPGITVAHKTGSSGRHEDGIQAAVNDVGIIVLPNGERIAITVFVSNTRLPLTAAEQVIADVAKVIVEYYLATK